MKAEDRDFLASLANVVFGNPFTAERAAVIRRLAPDAPGDLNSDREALARAVAPRLRALTAARPGAEERALLEPALAYVAYHRYVPQLDAHIEQQAGKAGAPLAAPVGEEAVRELVQNGFTEERAVKFFSFFFQLRRAFYFIERALAGKSDSMQRFRRALWNNMFTHDMRVYEAALWNRMEDFATLLLGETGTGKGEAAAAIGRSEFIPYLPGERRFAANFAESFIAINLSQFPETLVESELFGHRKGAFTGAIDHHQGVFERCSEHGALFLDEIGEVGVSLQIKLLRVLQERTFTPVGGREPKRFSGRVIAATNRPIAELRQSGRFREDFYYRLCSDVIQVPTLRQRLRESPAELAELVTLLVGRTAGQSNKELVAFVLEALERDLPRGYPWPGNVRELEQAVRRVLLTGAYKPDVTAAEADGEERLLTRLRQGNLTADELLSAYSAMLYDRLGSYAAVAERTKLDPRTSRKYILGAKSG
ncbi:MAG TPA: sigma 54-interacting transcriptional regulator [Burkholderiales bacterium]|nr:sigma 54-interacting transcriptional regulator [Burkholderiales bacterium]